MNSSDKEFYKNRVEKNPALLNLYRDILKDLKKVEKTLRFFSRSPNKLISEVSAYLFQEDGKRIRPALVILCSKLLGYKGKEHILMASLVETIHTASLIHDDIIDNSEIRRGKPTIHAKWGPNITVLLGDYLYIKALGLSLRSRYRRIGETLTDISAKMIDGELEEYYNSGNLELGEKEYLDIIKNKTASLFSASCQIGGIIANASEEEENFLAAYGASLGMSFQIIDDLLDFTGEEKVLGKPILSDLSEGRITLPLIYTLSNDGQQNRRRIVKILKRKKFEKDSLKEILRIVKSNGALEYTYQKAQEFSSKSKEIISRFPESAHRESLNLLSEFILTRKR